VLVPPSSIWSSSGLNDEENANQQFGCNISWLFKSGGKPRSSRPGSSPRNKSDQFHHFFLQRYRLHPTWDIAMRCSGKKALSAVYLIWRSRGHVSSKFVAGELIIFYSTTCFQKSFSLGCVCSQTADRQAPPNMTSLNKCHVETGWGTSWRELPGKFLRLNMYFRNASVT
jgi:hypothetical protein